MDLGLIKNPEVSSAPFKKFPQRGRRGRRGRRGGRWGWGGRSARAPSQRLEEVDEEAGTNRVECAQKGGPLSEEVEGEKTGQGGQVEERCVAEVEGGYSDEKCSSTKFGTYQKRGFAREAKGKGLVVARVNAKENVEENAEEVEEDPMKYAKEAGHLRENVEEDPEEVDEDPIKYAKEAGRLPEEVGEDSEEVEEDPIKYAKEAGCLPEEMDLLTLVSECCTEDAVATSHATIDEAQMVIDCQELQEIEMDVDGVFDWSSVCSPDAAEVGGKEGGEGLVSPAEPAAEPVDLEDKLRRDDQGRCSKLSKDGTEEAKTRSRHLEFPEKYKGKLQLRTRYINRKNNQGKVPTKVGKNEAARAPPRKLRRGSDWRDSSSIKNSESSLIQTSNLDTSREEKRVTRSYAKIRREGGIDEREPFCGRIVWGFCRGWWPGLVIDAEDVGLERKPNKMWVYWIREGRITELRRHTQVVPFSSMDRHEELLKLLEKNARNKRIRAYIYIMNKLATKFKYSSNMPYECWMRAFIEELGSELDSVEFYPYSLKIRWKLAKFKRQNIKRNAEASPEPEPVKPSRKPSEEKSAKDPRDDTYLPLEGQIIGAIAWAKIPGDTWWPSIIIDHRDFEETEPRVNHLWVMWYGDYQMSQVSHDSFLKFEEGLVRMMEYAQRTRKPKYEEAVVVSCKEYCSRLGYPTQNWTIDNVNEWVSVLKGDLEPDRTCVDPSLETDKKYFKYSHLIDEKLDEVKRRVFEDVTQREKTILSRGISNLVALNNGTVDKLCLACFKTSKKNLLEHPFFEGFLCKECAEIYKPTVFTYGNDGKSFYCTLCAGTGTVILCDSLECPRVFCHPCLKHLICPEKFDEIIKANPWICFFCQQSSQKARNCLVKPRSAWKERFANLFTTSSCGRELNFSRKRTRSHKEIRPCRKIRVLSPFDGISTGFLALAKAGIEVEVYFASEIDAYAMAVSQVHYGDRVAQLGDVREITEKIIERISPIDLVIGGSPCNDLSLANPGRLGFNDPKSSALLFYDFCRILELVEKHSEHHVFWLFENVASMPSRYREVISRNLGREPVLVDAADFSAMHRPRLFWHNLPESSFEQERGKTLQEVLTPNCNRYARTTKIQTVTTKWNSLSQGKEMLKPVMMNNKPDMLWITELEEIFGFPRHYTDVNNLSVAERLKLLGQAWSVPVITALLKPLRYAYQLKEPCD